MLPPFIIEQIRRREEEERRRNLDDEQRPRLEIPTPTTPKRKRTVEEGEEDSVTDESAEAVAEDTGDTATETTAEENIGIAGEHITDADKHDTGPPAAGSDSFSPV